MRIRFLLLLAIVCLSVQSRTHNSSVLSKAAQSEEDSAKVVQCGRILVRGSEQLTQSELCRLLAGVSDSPLDTESLKSAEADVLKELNVRGFLEAALAWNEADKTDRASGVVRILNIREGQIYHLRRLEMIGNDNTHDKVIRRRVPLQEGAPFDEELLELSIRRINQLGIFEEFTRSDVEARVNKSGHFVDLTFHLREKP